MADKAYSTYAARNSDPILEVLRLELASAKNVMEIGSGSGQHAVHFSAAMPHLHWQPTDRREYLQSIERWVADSGIDNLSAPLLLDVLTNRVPQRHFDAVFSANTAHIMSWQAVEKMFSLVDEALQEAGCFCLYGPFKSNGEFNASSNATFDRYLRDSDPQMGIRELQQLDKLASKYAMQRTRLYAMPANNYLVVWRREEH